MAIVGLCLCSFFLVFGLPALLLPALAKAKARAQRINCLSNLRQLALGVRIYSSENEDHFPDADKWCDSIKDNVLKEKVFHCPASRVSEGCTYAFNAKLSGKAEGEINPNTVMLFEIPEGWNMSGGAAEMLNHAPHGRGAYNVALADGSVQQVTAMRAAALRWDP